MSGLHNRLPSTSARSEPAEGPSEIKDPEGNYPA